MRRIASFLFIAAACASASVVHADGTPLRASIIDAKTVKLDGVLKEWGGLTSLGFTLKGNAGKPDIEAKAVLAYDDTHVFVAADVTDDVLKAGADHLQVVLGF